MANFYDDNDDLQYYMNKGLDWGPLVEMTEYRFKAPDGHANTEEAVEFYKSVLEMLGEFTAEQVAPHAKTIDTEHPTLENSEVTFPPVMQGIMDQLNALEFHKMCLPREMGGMNCPYLVTLPVMEMLARADVSVAAHVGFHGGMALAALVFSIYEGTTEFDQEKMCITKTRFPELIADIAAGEAWGSMDITEPGAGSDMAALVTRGTQDETGQWYLTGSKIFITSGHAKYHFVVAKTETREGGDAFSGLDDLSMFLVKAYEDINGERVRYAWFDKLEEKLGHHGSATVAVRYDKSPAELIGKRGEGFRLMLLLMNNARLGVGFESLGICEAAWRSALEYAQQRPVMGKTVDRHEMIADYLEEMRTNAQALRAIAMQGAWHEELTHKLRLVLQFMPPESSAEKQKMEADLARHMARSRRLTPLIKYMGSECAVDMAQRCIQIHGGYGYISEYGAEKLLRDAMVLPIYEGTSQIQSLMVMKDSLLGVIKAPGAFVKEAMAATWKSLVATGHERRVARLQRRRLAVLRYLLRRLVVTKLGKGLGSFKNWDPKRDFALAMLHAERLTLISIDVAVAEVLLAQAQRHPERAEILERYLERAEPRCRHLHYVIKTTGGRLLGTLKESGEANQESLKEART
jgi:alkylation response protein AidB-like acyl-CoA dehydrogenase